MPSATHFVLPDLLSLSIAFPDATNPHWKPAAAESRDWVNSYKVFSDRRRAFFFQGQSELLVSHCYPYAEFEQFRTCCDFVNLLFTIDEISDEQTPEDALITGNVFLHAMRDPEWSDGSKLARMTADFRSRLTRTVKPGSFDRFVERCQDYIECVVQEADLRQRGEILDLDSYLVLRRENSAVRVCFALIPYVLGIDLPEEVYQDVMVQKIYMGCVDMVCWANDIYSYNMELNSGLAGNNFMTVLMKTRNMDIQTASDFIGRHYQHLMDEVVAAKRQLRSFGHAVDGDIERYIRGCQHWAAGNLAWSFETPRYFGANRTEIKRSLVVPLKPLELEPLDD
ncbi:terpenoid synthase [Artomyces pyxidatus]|uniref:Terpenoid synthase n=1 Tax=Artomyces pyxidatus TaxID=48021 RepID=A0ACB8TC91_9AGAM|nr:terpenoid synthase [Artomyces pyxidatus]